MVPHAWHEGLESYNPEAVLQDGCFECLKRADLGLAGVLQLDEENFIKLWKEMLRAETGQGHYESENDARACGQLALVRVMLIKHQITEVTDISVR